MREEHPSEDKRTYSEFPTARESAATAHLAETPSWVGRGAGGLSHGSKGGGSRVWRDGGWGPGRLQESQQEMGHPLCLAGGVFWANSP